MLKGKWLQLRDVDPALFQDRKEGAIGQICVLIQDGLNNLPPFWPQAFTRRLDCFIIAHGFFLPLSIAIVVVSTHTARSVLNFVSYRLFISVII
jgi:hypothetical protein